MTSFVGSLISEPTPFVLVELTGPKNNLILEGRALPYKPLAFEGTMRSETTWYAGNPQGTLQMLGASENATTVTGKWKDRFLSNTTAFGIPVITGRTAKATFNGNDVANVRDLVEIVDGFRLRGQLIEMGWDQHIRQGTLKRFRHVWDRREDVEWEMEFDWINRGEPITPVAFGARFSAIDVLNQVTAAVDDLVAALDAPFAYVSSITNAINNALDTITEAVGALADIAEKAANALLAPLQVARSMLAVLQTVKDTANQIIDLYDETIDRAKRISANIVDQAQALAGTGDGTGSAADTGAGSATTGTATSTGSTGTSTTGPASAPQVTSQTETAGIATLTHEQVLEVGLTTRNVRVAARSLRAIAVLRANELEAQAITIPDIKSFVAKEGANLRDVSTQFYDTPEQWKRLLIYNDLKDSKLKAGQIILVPPASLAEDC